MAYPRMLVPWIALVSSHLSTKEIQSALAVRTAAGRMVSGAPMTLEILTAVRDFD